MHMTNIIPSPPSKSDSLYHVRVFDNNFQQEENSNINSFGKRDHKPNDDSIMYGSTSTCPLLVNQDSDDIQSINTTGNNYCTTILKDRCSTNSITNYKYSDDVIIDKEWICPCCEMPLVNPVVHVECGTSFCENCLVPTYNCPTCLGRVQRGVNCFPAPKNVISKLDKLPVLCSMCSKQVKRCELREHEDKYCLFMNSYKQQSSIIKESNELSKNFKEQLINNTRDLTFLHNCNKQLKIDLEETKKQLRIERERNESHNSFMLQMQLRQNIRNEYETELRHSKQLGELLEQEIALLHIEISRLKQK